MTAKCALKAAAKAAGRTMYEGRPCSEGHGVLRFTADSRCVECKKLAMRAHRRAHPAAARRLKVISELRLRYGVTEQQYELLFASQHGKCAICECQLVSCLDDSRLSKQGPSPVLGNVDHDHATGKVRGLLCMNCNHALGKFRDNQTVLLNAVRYLRESATA